MADHVYKYIYRKDVKTYAKEKRALTKSVKNYTHSPCVSAMKSCAQK